MNVVCRLLSNGSEREHEYSISDTHTPFSNFIFSTDGGVRFLHTGGYAPAESKEFLVSVGRDPY